MTDTPAGTGFTAVAAAFQFSVAIRADGSLVTWGCREYYGEVSDNPEGTVFVSVAAYDYHAVALHADGSLHSWVDDEDGVVSATPKGTGFAAVATGYGRSVATKDRELVSWGDDSCGQVSGTPPGNDFCCSCCWG